MNNKKGHYRISYFLGTGIKSFFRNGFMSFISIMILICSLLLCGSFFLLMSNINYNINKIDDFNEIVVYADFSVTAEDIEEMQAKIESTPNVASCRFIPKEESLEKEKARYDEEYRHLFESYEKNKDTIPIPDTFRIEYEDIEGVDRLVYTLEHDISGVSKVKSRKDIADNINKVKSVILIVCLILAGALIMASIFIISNTIRLTLKSRETEINIMRYIGATNMFITLPFIVESTIMAIIATAVSYGIQWASYKYITDEIVSDYGIVEALPFSDFSLIILAGFAAISLITCIWGTVASTKRYTKA